MYIARDCRSLKIKLKEIDRQKYKIGFVPTMGALHAGHLSLIDKAKDISDIVIVSIFVNKMQFNDITDFQSYPSDIKKDIKLLEMKEVDYLFIPSNSEIYEDDFAIKVCIDGNISNKLCGMKRQGHFNGVMTILTKLFNIIRPENAVFGLKDYQQYIATCKLVKDLNFDINIIGVDTIRENSGLALSSRNNNLTQYEREQIAPKLYKNLVSISHELLKGANYKEILVNAEKNIINNGFSKIDYLEIFNNDLSEYIENKDNIKDARIFVAAYIGNVRLIDNILISENYDFTN